MTPGFGRGLAVWCLGPIIVGCVATWVAARSAPPFFGSPAFVNPEQLSKLEGEGAAAVANAAWLLGDARTTRRILQDEINRLDATPGPEKARALLRFAVLDTNPDGQRALFAQACVAEPSTCDDVKALAQREKAARDAVQSQLPPGHPALPVSP